MKYLEKDIHVRNFLIKNRIVMAPIAQEKALDGHVLDYHLEYYNERTKGGNVGLVILEHAYVRSDGKANFNQLSCSNESDVQGLSELSNVIHKNNSKCVIEISHAGSSIKEAVVPYEGISPSGLSNPLKTSKLQRTHRMTIKEIKEIKNSYVNAALIAEKAGFDGVELHAAHGYLLNQFYSPVTNKRHDSYGCGSIENRIRVIIEIIREIRKKTSENFIVGVRLGACDYMDGGTTYEDSIEAAKIFEKEGIDFIDISGGMCFYLRPGHTEPGYFGDIAKLIRSNVKIPVILAGGVKTKDDAEFLLESACADMISVGRQFVYNKDWADLT